ncbi:MAG: thiamine diphosphokinase [Bacteroidales bacterium]|nr:thiamine diphosphokinase [Bacteroidales bacterium]
MEKTQQIVILAAGDFPTHAVPLQALREADFVVCCDSAYGQWKVESEKMRVEKPFVVVGDGDSLSEADKSTLGERWLQVDEQDYNDLHKAMAWAVARYGLLHSQYTILGATGRREDHTLGNIAYLVTFAEEHPGTDIEMLTDYGRFTAMTGRRTFATFPRQQVSILSMNPDQPIYGQGLRWPLDAFRARRWWQATLNEALGSEVTLSSDGWLVVFRTYEPKQ